MTGEMIERLIWLAMCGVSFFAGWQICQKNENRRRSSTHQQNQVERQKRATRELAQQFINCLDHRKRGKIRDVEVEELNEGRGTLMLLVKKDIDDRCTRGYVDVFRIDIPFDKTLDIHVSLLQPLQHLDSAGASLIPGYIGRDRFGGVIAEMERVLRNV